MNGVGSPSPWDLLNEADGLEKGRERTDRIRGALARLEQLEKDVHEARAVALAMMALDDPACLQAASKAVAVARESGASVDFPYAHLAEAFLKAERFQEAFDFAGRVDRERFEALDLHWRNIRLDGIQAAALVRLRRLSEAELVIQRLRRQLGREDDFDFLPAPTELAEALLALMNSTDESVGEEARRFTRRLSASIDIDAWFPPATAIRLRNAIKG